MNAALKNKIYAACRQLIDEKIGTLNRSLTDLTEGAENDSKSSAGDKHETARAMMQIEHEQLSRQLNEMVQQRHSLEKILSDPDALSNSGRLIQTDKGYFLLAVAIGKLVVEEIPVIVLSPQSPLGAKFLKAIKGEKIELNQVKYTIEDLY